MRNNSVPTRQKDPKLATDETNDNSAELKQFFQKNRSLKYLIGNDVLVRPNHNHYSFEREYFTIKGGHKKNQSEHWNVDNPGILNYVTNNPKRQAKN
jgi:hypothetical protein